MRVAAGARLSNGFCAPGSNVLALCTYRVNWELSATRTFPCEIFEPSNCPNLKQQCIPHAPIDQKLTDNSFILDLALKTRWDKDERKSGWVHQGVTAVYMGWTHPSPRLRPSLVAFLDCTAVIWINDIPPLNLFKSSLNIHCFTRSLAHWFEGVDDWIIRIFNAGLLLPSLQVIITKDSCQYNELSIWA